MANQFEPFGVKKDKKTKIPAKESKKRKGVWLGENLKEPVRETRVEHVCARCGQSIPRGLSAVKLTPLEKGKLAIDKIEYFHREGDCPGITKPEK